MGLDDQVCILQVLDLSSAPCMRASVGTVNDAEIRSLRLDLKTGSVLQWLERALPRV